MNNADEISQRERREVLRNDRRVREAATYHSVALGSVDDERGGRYATGGSKQTVIGAAPVSYPTQPSGSPWRVDMCPPEPPLGYSVDEMEPVGEAHERGPPPTSTAIEDVSGGLSDKGSAAPFRRRA
jgi:hypothetical protein